MVFCFLTSDKWLSYLIVMVWTCTPQIHLLKSSPPKMMVLGVGAFGRCRSHERSVFYPIGSREIPLPSTIWGQARRHWLWTRKNALTRMWPRWRLDPGLPSLQNCEKQISVVCKLPRLWYVVTAAQTDQDIDVVFWYMLLKNSVLNY